MMNKKNLEKFLVYFSYSLMLIGLLSLAVVIFMAKGYKAEGCYSEFINVTNFYQIYTDRTNVGVVNGTQIYVEYDMRISGTIGNGSKVYRKFYTGESKWKYEDTEQKEYILIHCPFKYDPLNYSDVIVESIVKNDFFNRIIFGSIGK